MSLCLALNCQHLTHVISLNADIVKSGILRRDHARRIYVFLCLQNSCGCGT